MRCVEQNEDAAIVLGVNTLATKIAAFAASAGTAGLVGAIYATWIGYIDPTDAFDDLLSVKPIVMAFIGGVGRHLWTGCRRHRLSGAGRVCMAQRSQLSRGILGIIIVALLIFMPEACAASHAGIEKFRFAGRPSRINKVVPPVVPS